MARRKTPTKQHAPADALVPRLRAAVKVVDEAIGRLAHGAPAPKRAPRKLRRG